MEGLRFWIDPILKQELELSRKTRDLSSEVNYTCALFPSDRRHGELLYELLGEYYRTVAVPLPTRRSMEQGGVLPSHRSPLTGGEAELIFRTLLNFDRPNLERWLRASFEDRRSPPAERLEFAEKLDQVDPGYLRSAQAGRSFDEIVGGLDPTRDFRVSPEFVKNHLKNRLLTKLKNSKFEVIEISIINYLINNWI
jgi:hypothetical protein